MSLCAVILAAGLSSRMGGKPKALCRLDGLSLLRHAVSMFHNAGVADCTVVTGHGHERVAEEARKLQAVIAYNPDYRDGMYTSIQTGLRAVGQNARFAGCFLLPVDIPLLSPAVPRTLHAVWSKIPDTAQTILLPSYKGRTGHPPLIGRRHFTPITSTSPRYGLRGYMAALAGEESASLLLQGRAFFHSEGAAVRCVPVDDPWILRDLDTPEELAAAEQFRRAREKTNT